MLADRGNTKFPVLDNRAKERLREGIPNEIPTFLSVWKERSEPLLRFTGQGAKDDDPTVRRLCLAALGSTLEDFGFCCKLDLENKFLAGERLMSRDAIEKEKAFAEFLRFLKGSLQALNQELAVAREALKDDDLAVCLSAYKTIENAATVRLLLRNRALLEPVIKEKKDPFNEPIKAVPALIKSLQHKELRVRLAALYVLETLTTDAAPAASALAAVLKDDNRFVRWGAARALRNMAPAGAANDIVTALAVMLTDDSPDVRNTAAVALTRYGPAAKGAVADLSKAFENGDEKMQLLAARALAAMGKEAKPAELILVAALANKQPAIRAAAATALGRLGTLTKESRTSLTKALADKDSTVQRAAAGALLEE